MTNINTLVRHSDIESWVKARKGAPAISRVLDPTGSVRTRLALTFAKRETRIERTPTQDDGIAPCSWSAWLAELDRQHLALRILDTRGEGFEFVTRDTLN